MTQTKPANSAPQKTKVVILGGGPSAVAAAFWLSDPANDGRYDITLYSQGWRLGGKCASGRNADVADRIEEHGLHILMGCYQNAFATLRTCYKEWRAVRPDPDNPLQEWTDGFKPQHMVSLMDRSPDGKWTPWNIPFPTLGGEPGDAVLKANAAPNLHPISGTSALVLDLMDRVLEAVPAGAPFRQAVETWFSVVRYMIIPDGTQPRVGEKVALEAAQSQIGQYLDGQDGGEPEFAAGVWDTLRMIAIGADLAVATTAGYISDLLGKGEAGYDALNTLDMREWLGKHGATRGTLNSGLVNAIYDLAFAQVGGEQDSPGLLAAGVSFRAQMEIAVGYNHAPLWRMIAGTADTVFTPLYDVLTARGVDIQLFQRVTGLEAAGGKLSQITVRRQARTIDGGPYRPLRRITLPSGKQLDSWPSEPDWAQLAGGAKLKADKIDFDYSDCLVYSDPPRTLMAGEDFDIAISGLPPLALEPLVGDLMAAHPEWASAIEGSASVGTQAMQLWMSRGLDALGWQHGSTVLTSYEPPYDSWGDMSEVIAFENWGEAHSGPAPIPHSLAYFCGTMAIDGGPISPPALTRDADKTADDWIDTCLSGLWPDLKNTSFEAQVVSSYVRANFDLSEQYVQTPSGGNVASRFDPAKPAGLSNFYAIGDWTKTRFSGGCFESAMESGMLAARAISGFPHYVKTT